MNQDGTGKGFALDITARVASALTIPVIASGGAGCASDFVTLFRNTAASAALAASIFHYNRVSLTALKQQLINEGINIRCI